MSAKPIGPLVRIRDLRVARGLSVADLAERIEIAGVPVHEGTIRNVELGRRGASDRLMAAWARALGISELDVWQGDAVPAVGASGESDVMIVEHAAIESYAQSCGSDS